MIDPVYQQRKINDLELAVRTIDDMLPDMPTKSLQKWQAIMRTTLLKIEKELTNNYEHTCRICFFKEWGYRDELPSQWYKKGGAEVCFQHEYADAEKLLKDAGHEVDAFFPPEIPEVTVESLKVTMAHLPPPPAAHEESLEELMAMV